jgi:hypothetical protein
MNTVINGPTKENCLTIGTGSPMSICLFMEQCGIGDNVHAAPVLWHATQNGYSITVYCRPFHKAFFEALGCSVFTLTHFVDGNIIVNETGEVISFDFIEKHPEFGKLYSLNEWGIWKEHVQGGSSQDRMEWFAELVDLPLPAEFSWVKVLGAVKNESAPYILFAPESTEVWRSLPEFRAYDTYLQLKRQGTVVWLSMKANVPHKRSCANLEELISLVYNARFVVGVESGVLNLAAALEIPTVGVYSITDPTHIIHQFNRYHPVQTETVFGEQPTDALSRPQCAMPCYRDPAKGFKNGKCLGTDDAPYCLSRISVNNIIKASESVIHKETIQCQQ